MLDFHNIVGKLAEGHRLPPAALVGDARSLEDQAGLLENAVHEALLLTLRHSAGQGSRSRSGSQGPDRRRAEEVVQIRALLAAFLAPLLLIHLLKTLPQQIPLGGAQVGKQHLRALCATQPVHGLRQRDGGFADPGPRGLLKAQSDEARDVLHRPTRLRPQQRRHRVEHSEVHLVALVSLGLLQARAQSPEQVRQAQQPGREDHVPARRFVQTHIGVPEPRHHLVDQHPHGVANLWLGFVQIFEGVPEELQRG
mmetsp:Transcript_12494/g.29514  ORF Transcript_12494/g.29514 Transcript_12494/m.29514 type:complete len:253 (-) Transcript_12494:520-1278(-)